VRELVRDYKGSIQRFLEEGNDVPTTQYPDTDRVG